MMEPRATGIALLLLGLAAALAAHQLCSTRRLPPLHAQLATRCTQSLGAQHVTALMFADPGDFSGSAEAKHILDNLKNKQQVAVGSTVCGNRFTGKLLGQDVTVITTGIGDTAAGLCAYEVLLTCGAHIKEIIYFGTSGWSPAKGGLLDADKCDVPNTAPQAARLGDVCVSPFSIDWVCKKATWDQQCAGYPNACYLPQEATGPDAAYLYGQCVFTTMHKHSLALADELISAASTPHAAHKAPRRVPRLQADEELYWGRMTNGTGGTMPDLEAGAAPRLWSYRHCSEVDGRFFYSGVPYEMLSREYVAHTINLGLNHSLNARPSSQQQQQQQQQHGSAWQPTASLSKAPNVTRQDVVAVAAMEGVGLAEAVMKYNLLEGTPRPVPFTNVRAMSNWLHQPLKQVSPGNWTYGQEVPEDFENGYSYAIATGSSSILAMFRQRCLDLGLHGVAEGACSYVVDYPGGGGAAEAAEAANGAAQRAVGEEQQGRGASSRLRGARQAVKLGYRTTVAGAAAAAAAAQR